jgi:hypothetical protein
MNSPRRTSAFTAAGMKWSCAPAPAKQTSGLFFAANARPCPSSSGSASAAGQSPTPVRSSAGTCASSSSIEETPMPRSISSRSVWVWGEYMGKKYSGFRIQNSGFRMETLETSKDRWVFILTPES